MRVLVLLVVGEHGEQTDLLAELGPVVLLGVAAVLSGRQPQLEPQPTLDIGPRRPSFQFIPAVQSGRGYILEPSHSIIINKFI